MKKPRSDKKLAQLTDEQADTLFAWMRGGLSYAEIRTAVAREFEIETSVRALSDWWEERVTAEEKARVLRAANVASSVGADLVARLPEITDALRGQLTQKAFEVALLGGDEKTIATLMGIVGDINKGELDRAKLTIDVKKLEQRVREYEEKNAAAKAALAGLASKGGLTPETIREIEEAAKLL